MPHFHVSGIHALITFLYIIVAFGSLHVLSLSFPDSMLSQAWIGAGF